MLKDAHLFHYSRRENRPSVSRGTVYRYDAIEDEPVEGTVVFVRVEPPEVSVAVRAQCEAPVVTGKPGVLFSRRTGLRASGRGSETSKLKDNSSRIREHMLGRSVDRYPRPFRGDLMVAEEAVENIVCGVAGSVIHDRAACSLLSSAAYTKPLPEEIPFRAKTLRGIASLTFAVARTKVVSGIGR